MQKYFSYLFLYSRFHITAITCTALTLANGTTTGNCNGTFNSTCTYSSCNSGFFLSGSGDTSRTCNATGGVYSGVAKTCVRKFSIPFQKTIYSFCFLFCFPPSLQRLIFFPSLLFLLQPSHAPQSHSPLAIPPVHATVTSTTRALTPRASRATSLQRAATPPARAARTETTLARTRLAFVCFFPKTRLFGSFRRFFFFTCKHNLATISPLPPWSSFTHTHTHTHSRHMCPPHTFQRPNQRWLQWHVQRHMLVRLV